MAKLDVMKTIKKFECGGINLRYDIGLEDVLLILDNSKGGKAEAVVNAFVFGYAQATKAHKAEMKKLKKEPVI